MAGREVVWTTLAGGAETAPGAACPVIDLGTPGQEAAHYERAQGGWDSRHWHRLATLALVGAGALGVVIDVAPPSFVEPVLVREVAPAFLHYAPLNPHGRLLSIAALNKPELSAEVATPTMVALENDSTRIATRIARRVTEGYVAARTGGDVRDYTVEAGHAKAGDVGSYTITEHLPDKRRVQATFGADVYGAMRLDTLEQVAVWDTAGGYASLLLIQNDDRPQHPVWRMVAATGSQATDWQTVYMGANGASLTPPSAMEADLAQMEAMYP